jgi:sporulation protein YlmC with PRC-barrel domain
MVSVANHVIIVQKENVVERLFGKILMGTVVPENRGHRVDVVLEHIIVVKKKVIVHMDVRRTKKCVLFGFGQMCVLIV